MIDLKDCAGSRYRIELDPSAELDPARESRFWYYRIPCRHGHVGVHGPGTLMAHCWAGSVVRGRLLAIPGVVVRQRGDREVNCTFPVDRLGDVAKVLEARRVRRLSPEQRRQCAERLAPHRFARTPAPI